MSLVVSVAFVSCSKDKEDNSVNGDDGSVEEVSLNGKWTSFAVDELGEFGELVARSTTTAYSVVFTETDATLVLMDLPNGSIKSTYEFKEGDASIMYFTSAFNDYGFQMVAQLTEEGQLVLLQTHSDWDFSFQYYFTKD